MKKWYVLQVMSSQEKKIKKAIEENCIDQGMTEFVEEVLVPSENVSEVKRGQQKISEKRLWPGYILIKIDLNDESWAFVKGVNGVIDFLGGEHPEPLGEQEIADLLRDLEEKKKGIVQKHKIEVGNMVKIVDGVFINFVGNVVEVNHEKGRLSVRVSIFGRDTRVDDLEFWQVERVMRENEG